MLDHEDGTGRMVCGGGGGYIWLMWGVVYIYGFCGGVYMSAKPCLIRQDFRNGYCDVHYFYFILFIIIILLNYLHHF